VTPTRGVDLDRVWTRVETVLWRRIPGAVLLFGRDLSEPVAVTGPGADIWALLEQPMTGHDASATLAATYRADEAHVAADVTRLLAQLEERGLVERLD